MATLHPSSPAAAIAVPDPSHLDSIVRSHERCAAFGLSRADRPDAVVALTRHSEEVGLDLATFQDHPYQRRYLDTWTLLSYLAARTERVKLLPDIVRETYAAARKQFEARKDGEAQAGRARGGGTESTMQYG